MQSERGAFVQRLQSFGEWISRHAIKFAFFIWISFVSSIFIAFQPNPITLIRPENQSEDFRNLLWSFSFIGGALVAAIALINALRRTRMTQREQDAEIFSKAIAQLGSESRETRLGAIYALEGLMRVDFAEPGRTGFIGQQIGDTLAAFIREQSRHFKDQGHAGFPPYSAENPSPKTSIDIEAAFVVIIRSWPSKRRLSTMGTKGVDLKFSYLDGIILPKDSNLEWLDLSHSSLINVDFSEANIKDSKINQVNFSNSDLSGVHISNSEVRRGQFFETILDKIVATNSNF